MKHEPDYYAVLGLEASAAPEQIKRAYRQRAKQAHPDAGGSEAAMQRLTEAYAVLSDESARRQFDRLRSAEAQAPGRDDPPAERERYEARAERMQAELHRRLRRAQARASALRLFKNSLGLAVMLGIVTRFFAAQTSDTVTKFGFGLAGFAPVYALLLSVVFLINPDLRLLVFDALRRKRLSRDEVVTLVALATAWVPLAAGWLLLAV